MVKVDWKPGDQTDYRTYGGKPRARTWGDIDLGKVAKYSPDQPRDDHGRWTAGGGAEFVSPSVTSQDLHGALTALGGQRQAAFMEASREVDQQLGVHGQQLGVVGAWSDGAENSTMTISPNASLEQLRLSAAMKGALADQKAVLVFARDNAGPDVFFSGQVRGDVAAIHQGLLAAGIENHTLAPVPGGARVYIADLGGAEASKVSAFAISHDATFQAERGHGEFIGASHYDGTTDAQQRAEGHAAYEAVIAQSGFAGPGGSSASDIWRGLRDRWATRIALAKGAWPVDLRWGLNSRPFSGQYLDFAKRALPPISAERPKIAAITDRLSGQIAHHLAVLARNIAPIIRARLAEKIALRRSGIKLTMRTEKVAKADETTAQRLRREIEAIIDELGPDWSEDDPETFAEYEEARETGEWTEQLLQDVMDAYIDEEAPYTDDESVKVATELADADEDVQEEVRKSEEAVAADDEAATEEVHAEAAKEAIGQVPEPVLARVGVTDPGQLVDQVYEPASLYARDRSAELVGKRVLPDGTLVDNPDATMAITELTRTRLRDVIANGLKDNIGLDGITKNIVDDFAFSAARADLIARTEVSRANEQGKLSGWQQLADVGVPLLKSWLTVGDDRVDEDICAPNEAEGPIGLDEVFGSGDDAPPGHPNCRCVLISELADGSDQGGEEADVEA